MGKQTASRRVESDTPQYNPGWDPEFVDTDGQAWFDLGVVWVDTGKLMLTDPGYVCDFESDEYPSDPQTRDEYDYSYSGASLATTFDDYDQVGEGRGFVFRMGDGRHRVLGRFRPTGALAEIRVGPVR